MSVGISLGTAALISGGLAAAGGVTGAVLGSKASGKAADQQSAANQAAIEEEKRQFDISQGNAKPFISAGQDSIAKLMEAINSGKFGPGSLGPAPGDFKAPTAEEARATPGYQFILDQQTQNLQRNKAAQGRVSSGGEEQALARLTGGISDSTYNSRFSQALQGYQANLAGDGTKLATQGQEFQELLAPAQLGSGQASSIGQIGQSSANSIAQLMQGIGSAQAGGTIGGATAVSGGIGSGINGITGSLSLAQILKSWGGGNQSGAGLNLVRPGDEAQFGAPG